MKKVVIISVILSLMLSVASASNKGKSSKVGAILDIGVAIVNQLTATSSSLNSNNDVEQDIDIVGTTAKDSELSINEIFMKGSNNHIQQKSEVINSNIEGSEVNINEVIGKFNGSTIRQKAKIQNSTISNSKADFNKYVNY